MLDITLRKWISKHSDDIVIVLGALTEVERDSGVVVRFAVGDEVDLVLPLLLLEAVLGAAVVAHAAATQDEDDRPNHPKPCQTHEVALDRFKEISTHAPGDLIFNGTRSGILKRGGGSDLYCIVAIQNLTGQ